MRVSVGVHVQQGVSEGVRPRADRRAPRAATCDGVNVFSWLRMAGVFAMHAVWGIRSSASRPIRGGRLHVA